MQRQILINVMIFFAYALNLPLNTQRSHHRSQRAGKLGLDFGSWKSPDISRSHLYRGTFPWTPPTAIYRAYTVPPSAAIRQDNLGKYTSSCEQYINCGKLMNILYWNFEPSSRISSRVRGQRPISVRTYFRHICFLGVNFMQLWFSFQIDFWSRLWIPPQIFWWIHIRKIKNRGIVSTTEREMARNTLTSG